MCSSTSTGHARRCAANVLLDFAEHGHQVLMFTCHEHIVQLFLHAPAEIRYLSDCVLAEPAAVPEPKPEVVDELPTLAAEEPLPALVEPEVETEEEYDLSDTSNDQDDEDYALGAPAPVRQPSPLEFLLAPADSEPEFADIDDEEEDEEEVEIDEEEYEVEEAADDEVEFAEAEYEDAVDEETAEKVLVSEPAEEMKQPMQRPRSRQRFCWESPERWWDTDRSDEAA